jgi:hypothetical protein
MSLKPSVMQMLEVAQGCELKTLQEAYDNYMLHYDMFFLIEKYQEQYSEFVAELYDLGLANNEMMVDMTIEAVLEKLCG